MQESPATMFWTAGGSQAKEFSVVQPFSEKAKDRKKLHAPMKAQIHRHRGQPYQLAVMFGLECLRGQSHLGFLKGQGWAGQVLTGRESHGEAPAGCCSLCFPSHLFVKAENSPLQWTRVGSDSYPPRTAPFCRENDSLTAPTSTYKAGRRTFLKHQLRHFSSQSLYGYIAMLHLKFWGLFCFPDIFTGKEVKRVVQKEKRTHYVHSWEDGSVGRVSAVQA